MISARVLERRASAAAGRLGSEMRLSHVLLRQAFGTQPASGRVVQRFFGTGLPTGPRGFCRSWQLKSHAKSATPRHWHVPTSRQLATLRIRIVDGYYDFRSRPGKYLTIPLVAAIIGLATNWIGVKMLFYPIEPFGPQLYRQELSPYGLFFWQGVVPTKAASMAQRLTDVITQKLFSVKEAFGRLDAREFAHLLQPSVEEAIRRDAPNGQFWACVTKPLLPWVLERIVRDLQRDMDKLLDVEAVVTHGFLRDVEVLVALFQQVGRVELDFLVYSGFFFGAMLGFGQMFAWGLLPTNWTLPVAGALVGYVTNWIAIFLIFDPVEPVQVGPFTLQGLFEKRQHQISSEMAAFLEERVLTSPALIEELAEGTNKDRFQALVRKNVPFVVPDSVCVAAAGGLSDIARQPESHPVHQYMRRMLGIEETLTSRLRQLSSPDFEALLHPVFKEDEIILIVVGGVLGFVTGIVQYWFNFGGPAGVGLRKAHLLAVK
eukprot:TRINITY_DN13423_c0_g1_i1.p1 TRINITY_DN13423_c0_g1~~TRINITY_DN13423_c0_g1_i1.p1  ORF type:complete len:488 (+),score=55.03 TRINITY_DN13423_c0_g1_i1:51-1514(+)